MDCKTPIDACLGKVLTSKPRVLLFYHRRAEVATVHNRYSTVGPSKADRQRIYNGHRLTVVSGMNSVGAFSVPTYLLLLGEWTAKNEASESAQLWPCRSTGPHCSQSNLLRWAMENWGDVCAKQYPT